MNPDAFFDALNAAGVDFVVVGGLAANVHGSQRVTKDVDIAYHTEANNLRRLCKAVNAMQPRMLVPGEPEGRPVTLTPDLLKRHPLLQLSTNVGEIDLLSSIAGFKSYGAIKDASEPLNIEGRDIRMLTRAGVIKSKRALNRPKDIDDINQLKALAELEDLD